MENLTHFSHSSNPSTQPLLITLTNHVDQTTQKKNTMKNFEELIFKLAETHPNNILNPATKTLLQCRLNRFVSEYKTPDHLPYSAMILTALGELNEKTGSSVESISQHLEKNYDNLPFAHSVLLKHHLEKLCDTGEILVTRDKKYGLPGRLKRRGRRRKWRYDWERNSHNRRKQKLIKQRKSQKCEKDEVEYDEKERRVTENEAISENKSNQTKLLRSCVNEKDGICGEESSQQQPPGFELINVETLSHPISRDLEIESAGSSSRALRWRNRLHRKLSAITLTSLKSSNEMETHQDQKRSVDLSPITTNHEDVVDELQPKCRRLRVLLKPKPDTADVKDLRVVNDQRRKDDCTLLHCNANQTLQPAKRRPGRPPKQAVVS